jgi:hypothetical protein
MLASAIIRRLTLKPGIEDDRVHSDDENELVQPGGSI